MASLRLGVLILGASACAAHDRAEVAGAPRPPPAVITATPAAAAPVPAGLCDAAQPPAYRREGAALVALDADRGERWRVPVPAGEAVEQVVACGPATMAVVTTAGGDRLRALDERGELRWELALPGLGEVRVSCRADGELAIAGHAAAGADLDPTPAATVVAAARDFVTRLGPAGELRFARALAGDPTGGFLDAAVDERGGVYVTSGVVRSRDVDPGPAQDRRTTLGATLLVAHYDAAGSYEWSYVPTGVHTWLRAQTLGSDGGLLIGGTFRGEVDFDPRGAHDVRAAEGLDDTAFVVRLTPAGAVAWTWTAPMAGLSAVVRLERGAGCVRANTQRADAGDLDPGPALIVGPDDVDANVILALDDDGGALRGVAGIAAWHDGVWSYAPAPLDRAATCGGWPARPCAIDGLRWFVGPGHDAVDALGAADGVHLALSFDHGLALPDGTALGRDGARDAAALRLDLAGEIVARTPMVSPGEQSLRALAVTSDGSLVAGLDEDVGAIGWDPSGGEGFTGRAAHRATTLLIGPDGVVRWRHPGFVFAAAAGADRICTLARDEIACRRPDGTAIWRVPMQGDVYVSRAREPQLHLDGDGSLEVCVGIWTPARVGGVRVAPTTGGLTCLTIEAGGRLRRHGRELALTHRAGGPPPDPLPVPALGALHDVAPRTPPVTTRRIAFANGTAIEARIDCAACTRGTWELAPGHTMELAGADVRALFAFDAGGARVGQWAIVVPRLADVRLELAGDRPCWAGSFAGLAELEPGPRSQWVATAGRDAFVLPIADFPVERLGRRAP